MSSEEACDEQHEKKYKIYLDGAGIYEYGYFNDNLHIGKWRKINNF